MIANQAGNTAVNQTSLELKGDREFVITRAFNGPAAIVFEAWTRPDLVKRWFGPKTLGVSVSSCEGDVRAGGTYRCVMRVPNGSEFAFSGAYSEVVPARRIVYTQFFEPTASGANPGDQPITVTVTFDEREGKTHVVSTTVCPSPEVRDAIISSGMEHGMRVTMDQLEEVIATLP